jgi:hypothetical protein
MKMLPTLTLALAGLFLTSCGTFERKWNESVAEYQSGKVASPAGPWTGSWSTATNGHTGDLRAIVTPAAGEPGKYDFHYHATWADFLSGAYKVRFPVVRRGDSTLANGEKKLGIFGTFGHKATISKNAFKATYSNDKGDLGTFEMRRPE